MKTFYLVPLILVAACKPSSELHNMQVFGQQLQEAVKVPAEGQDPNLYERIRKQSEDPDLPQNLDLKLSQELLEMKRLQTSAGCSSVSECPN